MAETRDQSDMENGTSAEAPSGTSEPSDLSGFEAFMAKLDERFSGFQSVIDKRLARVDSLESTLNELKTANLPEEEREQLKRQAEAQQIEALRTENELLKLARKYPEEYDLFSNLLKAESAEDQLALIRQLRTGNKSPEDEQREEPAPVDRNNPRRRNVRSEDTYTDESTGAIYTLEEVDRMLTEAGRGGLVRGR